MTTLVTCTLHGTIGVLTIDSPPVNALSVGVRSGLMQGIARLAADPQAKAIVIACSGRKFVWVYCRAPEVPNACRGSSAFLTPDVIPQFRASHAERFRGLKAPLNIIEAVEAAVSLHFEEGLARETELFNELLNGKESAALRHVFFAERAANKVPGLSPDAKSRPIHAVGVIGAGTMGSGIAMCFVDAGIPVTLVDREAQALERGMNIVRKNYDILVKKGRMTSQTAEERMSLVSARLDPGALDTVDLVIEAVYESMELKTRVFAEIDRIVKPGAFRDHRSCRPRCSGPGRAGSKPARRLGRQRAVGPKVRRRVLRLRSAAKAGTVACRSAIDRRVFTASARRTAGRVGR